MPISLLLGLLAAGRPGRSLYPFPVGAERLHYYESLYEFLLRRRARPPCLSPPCLSLGSYWVLFPFGNNCTNQLSTINQYCKITLYAHYRLNVPLLTPKKISACRPPRRTSGSLYKRLAVQAARRTSGSPYKRLAEQAARLLVYLQSFLPSGSGASLLYAKKTNLSRHSYIRDTDVFH